jgi:glucose/arabinose dehydrogenase
MGVLFLRLLNAEPSGHRWSTLRLRAAVLLMGAALAGCNSNRTPMPSPGNETPQTISGRERIGWDQPASSAAELAAFGHAIYVDGTRSEVADRSCAATAGTSGFPCSGQLPPMTPGTHVLELAAFTNVGGIVEGPRSAPLRVTVTGSTSPAPAPVVDGERLTTSDGAQLSASLVIAGLEDVTDMALAPDGRLVIAERSGGLVFTADEAAQPFRAAVPQAGLLSIALDPDFARTAHVFLVQALSGTFRVSRYRLAGNQLVERIVLLPDISASADPSAVLRFGPDGRLYAAFDDGGSPDAAARLSDWSGKLLRLNPDGRTPDDQPAASPVFWSGLGSPHGLDWAADGGALWIVEKGSDGIERIRALVTGDERPRRAGQRASYVLPGRVGASSLAFYRGDAVGQFRGDMFIAARESGYLLRIRFDEHERTRAMSTEKLLEGKVAGMRAVLAGPDGALYFATETAAWRLAPIASPRSAMR